uniref:Secreted protein n=1 Tax=Panagrellus redivivus TaxID=6233 RepID=A0A7E4VMI3_PANRE
MKLQCHGLFEYTHVTFWFLFSNFTHKVVYSPTDPSSTEPPAPAPDPIPYFRRRRNRIRRRILTFGASGSEVSDPGLLDPDPS